MATLEINGTAHRVEAPDDMPLLWAIRDIAGLTGTKYGCGAGLCGSCVVHLDGKAVKSCITSVGQAAGKPVTTIEGLDPDGAHPLQVAWRDFNVPQCGFCQAGQIMQAAALLEETPDITEDQILAGMRGNVCRCGCYQRIVAAVRHAATGG